MSETHLSEQDDASAEPAPDGKHKQQQTATSFFRFRPLAFIQHSLRRYEARHAAKYKNRYDYYANRPAPSPLNQLLLLIAIATSGVALLWTWYADAIGPETVIAIFTVVMTFTTWRNWVEMQIQNEIMIKQISLADATIQQMRNSERPWLCVTKIRLVATESNEAFYCKVGIVNCGRTPGTIRTKLFHARCEFPETRIKDQYSGPIDRHPWIADEMKSVQYVIAPGQAIELDCEETLSANDIRGFRTKGALCNVTGCFAYGQFTYSDTADGPGVYQTDFHFKLLRDTDEWQPCPDGNYWK